MVGPISESDRAGEDAGGTAVAIVLVCRPLIPHPSSMSSSVGVAAENTSNLRPIQRPIDGRISVGHGAVSRTSDTWKTQANRAGEGGKNLGFTGVSGGFGMVGDGRVELPTPCMSSVMKQNATCCHKAPNTATSATYAKLQLSGNATKNHKLPLNVIRNVIPDSTRTCTNMRGELS